MDGKSVIVSPSKVNCQSFGVSGVTTSFPQPQQHLCTTVAYVVEIYNTPVSSSSGMNSTNLCCIFMDELPSIDGIGCITLPPQVLVKPLNFFHWITANAALSVFNSAI